jgi:hypothetical protein
VGGPKLATLLLHGLARDLGILMGQFAQYFDVTILAGHGHAPVYVSGQGGRPMALR